MAPMPCSALIEPPNSFTMSCTVAAFRPTGPGTPHRRPPSAALKLKCRLPSPRWPKLTAPRAGRQLQHRRRGAGQEIGDRRHRHGNVMLDRGAFALLGFRRCFRAASTAPRPGPRWPPPPHQWRCRLPMASASAVSNVCSQVGIAPAGRFHQHIPGRGRRQRIAGAGDMAGHKLQRHARDQFKGRQHAAGARLHAGSAAPWPRPATAPRRTPSPSHRAGETAAGWRR